MTVPSEPQKQALRRALLQRLVDDMAALTVSVGPQSCCWLSYTFWAPRRQEWLHRLCPPSCTHWHHQTELWMG